MAKVVYHLGNERSARVPRVKSRRVNIKLPQTQIDALNKIAARGKRTFSSVVREAIEEYTGVPDTIEYGSAQDEHQKDTMPAAMS